MVKLNTFSSTSRNQSPAITPSEKRHNVKQKTGNRFGSEGGDGKMTTPKPTKTHQNEDENSGKRMPQSEPRKPFQRQHQHTPTSATKSILKMPNGGASSASAAIGGIHQRKKQFHAGHKRRVSFGSQSESNDSFVKQRKVPKIEQSAEQMTTPKIGQQKINGSASSGKGTNGPQNKLAEEKQSNVTPLTQQPKMPKSVAGAIPMPTAPSKKQQNQSPKAFKQKGAAEANQKKKTASKNDQQTEKPKSEQTEGLTRREKKRKQRREKLKELKQKKQPKQQQTDEPGQENLKKNEKKNQMKLTRKAVERLEEAAQMIQRRKAGSEKGTAEEKETDKGDKDAVYHMVASSLEHLLPVRFVFGKLRSSARLVSQQHSNSIVQAAVLLEPKKFKQFGQLISGKKGGVKTAAEDAENEEEKSAKAEQEEEDEEQGESDQRTLALCLCVLSAAVCLLGNALPSDEDSARRREEYLNESTELRKMAKNLLADAGQWRALVSDMAPVLVDMVIAWVSRPAWIHRALGAFLLCRFAKWLASHFDPVLQAFIDKDVELLKEETLEEEDDDGEETDDDDEEEEDDEGKGEEEEETANLDPKLVADVRRAMGKAAIPENAKEVPSDEDNWELDDEQMSRLDHDLARAFRSHSSKRSELARQTNIFRLRLIELMGAYLSTAPYTEAMSLCVHIFSSIVWCANGNHKKLGIQLVDPLIQRKKENTLSTKRLVKLFKQLIDGAEAVDESQTDQQQHIFGRREATSAVVRAALMLFSLAADHTEQRSAPELLRFVEHQVLNDYFAEDRNTNKAFLQSSLLRRLCSTYPQYLGPEFLPTLLSFTVDNKMSENKKHQAFNLARTLVTSRKDSPRFYATVLDEIGAYLLHAIPLYIKKASPSLPPVENDNDAALKRKREQHLLAKFVFILGWYLKIDNVGEAYTNAIKKVIAKTDVRSLDEQTLMDLLANDGMKELRTCLKMRGAIQQFGGDKLVAHKFVTELGKKLETDEEETDEEEEDEEGDAEGGEESDDEMDEDDDD